MLDAVKKWLTAMLTHGTEDMSDAAGIMLAVRIGQVRDGTAASSAAAADAVKDWLKTMLTSDTDHVGDSAGLLIAATIKQEKAFENQQAPKDPSRTKPPAPKPGPLKHERGRIIPQYNGRPTT